MYFYMYFEIKLSIFRLLKLQCASIYFTLHEISDDKRPP